MLSDEEKGKIRALAETNEVVPAIAVRLISKPTALKWALVIPVDYHPQLSAFAELVAGFAKVIPLELHTLSESDLNLCEELRANGGKDEQD